MPVLFDLYKKLPPRIKLKLKRGWFEILSRMNTGDDLLFLNHGYADRNNPSLGLDLQPEDEPFRYPIQLYHRIAADTDWKGLKGLEIGCGRGGGTAYVHRYLGSESMIGIDITESAIAFCKERFQAPGLSFEVGDAEALTFADASFDAILNVESCLHYKHIEKFYSESFRVLKPGGVLLIGDYRKQIAEEKMRRKINESGFEVVGEEDLSADVLAAMEIEADSKQNLVDRYAPRALHGLFTKFAGATGEGDKEIEAFRTGERIYLRFVLRKPHTA